MPNYLVKKGFNYAPGEKRAEPGDVVGDLTPGQATACGAAIEPTDRAASRVPRDEFGEPLPPAEAAPVAPAEAAPVAPAEAAPVAPAEVVTMFTPQNGG